MFTLSDKKYLKENFVTHDYLDLRFRLFEQRMEEKFVTKDDFNRKMNQVFENFDIIIGELKAIREELAAALYRQIEHTNQLEDYGHRLVILEKRSKIN